MTNLYVDSVIFSIEVFIFLPHSLIRDYSGATGVHCLPHAQDDISEIIPVPFMGQSYFKLSLHAMQDFGTQLYFLSLHLASQSIPYN